MRARLTGTPGDTRNAPGQRPRRPRADRGSARSGAGGRARGSGEGLAADPALVSEQVVLALDSAAVAGQVAVGAHYPVAGDDDADRVPAVGQADGARRGRLADLVGELSVRERLAVGDVLQGRSDPALERGAVQGEREVELGPV